VNENARDAAEADSGPISPELIMISSSEIARLARARLPERFTWATDHEGELSRLGVRAAPSALGLHATAVAPDQAAGLLQVPVRASAASPLEEEGETSRYPGVSVLSPSVDKPRTRRWAGSPRTAGVVLVAFAALGLSIAKAITYLTAAQPSRSALETLPSPRPSAAKTQSSASTPAPPNRRTAPAPRAAPKIRPSGPSAGATGRKASATRTTPPTSPSTTPPLSTKTPRSAPTRRVVAPTSSATPKQTKVPGTVRGSAATFVPSRVFGWPAQPQNKAYVVRFYRDGKKVYETQSSKPQITLPPSFVFAAGHYRWQVVPVRNPGSQQQQQGAAIVDSTFIVTAAAARAAVGSR
jgi:hypothetical protein